MEIITMQIKNLPIPLVVLLKYMELIEEFLNRGWKVHHILPRGLLIFITIARYHESEISILPSFIPFSIQAFTKFLSLQRNTKVDAVVTFSFLEGLLGVLFKVLNNNIKVIVAIHGDHIAGYLIDSNYITKVVCSQVLQLVEKIVLRHSDSIIFVSEYNRSSIIKKKSFTQIDKTKLIYNNITKRVIALSKEPPVSFSQDKKILGYVGSLYAEGKGLTYLISAFHMVKQKNT